MFLCDVVAPKPIVVVKSIREVGFAQVWLNLERSFRLSNSLLAVAKLIKCQAHIPEIITHATPVTDFQIND